MRNKAIMVATAAAGLALGAAACGSSGTTASSSSSSSAPAAISVDEPASTTTADFGPGCASVPSSGAGSFGGMSAAPVATAASANPLLSTLVTAVKKANLVDTLNSAKGITVFAPDNSAFAKIPAATLGKVLADKTELTTVLTYHVAAGRITPAELASGKPIKTLEGGTITPSKMGSTYEINSVARSSAGTSRPPTRPSTSSTRS